MENKKPLFFVLILLAIAALAAGAFFYMGKSGKKANNQKTEVVKTEVSASQLPAGLPKNLPIEAGSQIIQNYEAKSTNSETIQGTKKFTTEKSLEDAVKTYTDFFAKTAWEIIDSQKTNDYESALMRRNDSTVLVVARKDSALGKNVVEISLTEKKRN
jgi:basic membrane lipoprotein Med (substrate-binding protein (PBP1-ABC) superfamily)